LFFIEKKVFLLSLGALRFKLCADFQGYSFYRSIVILIAHLILFIVLLSPNRHRGREEELLEKVRAKYGVGNI